MNVERFQTNRDGFDILDFRASFDFKTESSIGFQIIRTGIYRIGAMQVHHPCSGHIKARIHFQLPKKYCDAKQISEMGMRAFSELEIPRDETYEFKFDSTESGADVTQPVDREGMTDRI